MAFLSLQNIGKIYVSAGNVAVGIRGVNLSFEKGEFVAVTGESGSGKSTLLNVISGMDSYEEGELSIEGRPTSHYLEPDREKYREKYISFIFQDYNILDSFTVLQNVELALMSSIEDPVKRRARAIELLQRVGLGDKLRQRGSRLSGGQKQRTVIARALAKDSPIILADEPTGNLDSESAREIMALLKEVSKDRLLIVVTHNVEEVAGYATREIRVFDGAVTADRRLAAPAGASAEADGASVSAAEQTDDSAEAEVRSHAGLRTVWNGITLGRAMFSATPKLSLFMCLLMLLASLGLLSITAQCGKVPKLLAQPTMFAPMDGRLVVTRTDGLPLGEEELQTLAKETDAESTLHYDYLLDAFQNTVRMNTEFAGSNTHYGLQPVYGQHFNGRLYGREPSSEKEALLYLPISCRPEVGAGEDFRREVSWCGLEYEVVGVQYYYDNNLTPKILLTEDGFACALAAFLLYDADKTIRVGFTRNGENSSPKRVNLLLPSFAVPANKVYVNQEGFTDELDEKVSAGYTPFVSLKLNIYYHFNNSFFSEILGTQQAFEIDETVPGDYYMREQPEGFGEIVKARLASGPVMLVNPVTLSLAMEAALAEQYTQASLFYGDDKEAGAACEMLRGKGYISSLSTDKYSPQAYETVLSSANGVLLLLLWLLTVIFMAFFINLCTGKAVGAFKHDLAILRSMGISVRTVISGLFTRLYLALLPSVLFVILLALVIYRTPKGNAAFPYLYWWQYLMIFAGMVIMTARVGKKQVRKLFGESVREALRGGDEA